MDCRRSGRLPNLKIGWRKTVGAAVAIVLLLGAAGVAAIELRWRRTFDAPYPDLKATTDPATVADGRYLAYGPATCAHCHVPLSEWPRLAAGETPPLSGNHLFPLPFGRFYSPNLTPDRETGIGRRTDGELARMLRHGVRADGRAAFPFMEYQRLSDADVVALISFLRSQPAVRRQVPEHELDFMGKFLMAFAIEPEGPATAPLVSSPAPAATVARGEYLANDVSLCVTCHTNRNRSDFAYVGPKFAGGQRMDFASDPTKVLVPPNLTPDPKTGRISRWSEGQFVGRFRLGTTVQGSIMPWSAYGRMSDEDLRAIYRYLRSLPPVKNDTGPVIQNK